MPGFIGDEASQVEQIAASAKRACRLATVSNIADLSAVAEDSAAFDGLTVAVTWRVLVLAQTDPVENGVYVVADVTDGVAELLRASDFDTDDECPSGTLVSVGAGGDTLANTIHQLTTADPVEIGTSELTFTNLSRISPTTTEGDLIYRGATVDARLAKGTAKQILRMNSGATAPEWADNTECFAVAVTDETTQITTGTKLTFRMPYGMVVTKIKVSLTTPGTTTTTVDVNNAGDSILNAAIDLATTVEVANSTTFVGAAASVTLAEDAEISVDIDAASTDAAGLKVYLIGRPS